MGATLKRLGVYGALVAVAILFLGTPSPEVTRLLRLAVVAGIALAAAGFLVDSAPRGRCVRCGRGAVAGTVFCAMHGQELKREASAVASRRAKEHRDW